MHSLKCGLGTWSTYQNIHLKNKTNSSQRLSVASTLSHTGIWPNLNLYRPWEFKCKTCIAASRRECFLVVIHHLRLLHSSLFLRQNGPWVLGRTGVDMDVHLGLSIPLPSAPWLVVSLSVNHHLSDEG